jgi:hypothetical protein
VSIFSGRPAPAGENPRNISNAARIHEMEALFISCPPSPGVELMMSCRDGGDLLMEACSEQMETKELEFCTELIRNRFFTVLSDSTRSGCSQGHFSAGFLASEEKNHHGV